MRDILVIEDDLAICEVIQAGLEDGGDHRVRYAIDVDEACAELLRKRPDVVLIDATVSQGSGIGLARVLLDLGILVILMTGEPRYVGLLRDAGTRLLKKPFRLATLRSEIDLAIENARSRRVELAQVLDRIERELAALPQPEFPSIRRPRLIQDRLEMSPVPGRTTAQFDQMMAAGMHATGAEMGTLQRLDASDVLRIIASHGFGRSFLDFFSAVHRDGDSACGAALRHGGRIIVPDLERSPIFANKPSGIAMREAGVRSVQSTPIVVRNGLSLGMISTHRPVVWRPDDAQLAALDTIANRIAADFAAS